MVKLAGRVKSKWFILLFFLIFIPTSSGQVADPPKLPKPEDERQIEQDRESAILDALVKIGRAHV